MTWLIAEDEADIRNLIALMCQVWGHTPLTFENGQKVWDWLDTVEQGQPNPIPDLILMDIRMPGKKGNELANRMRTIAPLQRTPIVLMTAFSLSDQERSEMISGDGVDRILSKPLPDFDQLRGILDEIVQQKQESVTEASASTPPAPEVPVSSANPAGEVQDSKPATEPAAITSALENESAVAEPPTLTEAPATPASTQETNNPPAQETSAKETDQT